MVVSSAFSAFTLLVGQQEGHPVYKKTEWCIAGMVICLERGADFHTAQLMALPLTVSCFGKIKIGFSFLVLAHLGSPGKKAIKRVCVCVCVVTVCVVNPSGYVLLKREKNLNTKWSFWRQVSPGHRQANLQQVTQHKQQEAQLSPRDCTMRHVN